MSPRPLAAVLLRIHQAIRRRVGDEDGPLLARFTANQDETAFAALVQRHGPMVLAAGRRVLPDPSDAEDVFQATFLLLARKAGALRSSTSLGAWLHRTATRLALALREQAARRRKRERAFVIKQPIDPASEAAWRELGPLLDAELLRLPDKYRLPVVLCCLEGMTHDEAARELGWPRGSVAGRLSRARELLRARLTRRGVTLTAAALSALLADTAARAAMSADLICSTIKVATAFASGPTARVSGNGAALSEGVLKSAWASQVKAGIAIVATVGLAAVAAAWIGGHLPLISAPSPAASADPNEPLLVDNDQFGDSLPPGAVARLGSVRLSPGQCRTVIFSPDSKILAASGFASRGNPLAIHLWDVTNGKEIGRFPGDSNYLAFSPDGGRLAVSHEMGELCVYDVVAGKELWRVDTHGEKDSPKMGGIAFSPDGKMLTAAVGDDTIRQYETAAGKEVSRLKAKASNLIFAPGGKTLASFHFMEKTVTLWDPATGKSLQTLQHTEAVYAVAFSPDGLSLAVHPSSNTVFLWDVAKGKILRQVDAPGIGYQLRFSANGNTLTTGKWSFDLTTGKETRQFDGLSDAALSPDGRLLASNGYGTLRIWDVATGREVVPLDRHDGPIQFVVPSADGKTIRTVGKFDHTIREWEAGGKHLRCIETWPWQEFRSLSGDGKLLATPQWDKDYVLVDLASGKSFAEGIQKNDHVGAMALWGDGRRLALRCGEKEKVVRIWNTANDKKVTLQGNVDDCTNLAFSPDGQVLAVAANVDRISLWDTTTGKALNGLTFEPKRRQYPSAESICPASALGTGIGVGGDPAALPSPAASLLFSPSGKTLAVTSGHYVKRWSFFDPPDAGLVRLYDVPTGKELFQLVFQEAVAVFSPDGKTLATGGHHDFAVYLWDAANGRELAHFEGHRGEVAALAFSADGTTLTSGSEDGTALVWDLSGVCR